MEMAREAATDRSNGQTEPETPSRPAGLKVLDRLVGTWRVSGETQGTITYEWLDGGFFMIARGDIDQGGKKTRHMEIIGYDHAPGSEPASTTTSRLHTSRGDTLNYTHEVDEKRVTSWFGEKGSPGVFKAQWSDDGNTLTGAWEWPGGGYKLTMTRVK